jgi:hypothetical protein
MQLACSRLAGKSNASNARERRQTKRGRSALGVHRDARLRAGTVPRPKRRCSRSFSLARLQQSVAPYLTSAYSFPSLVVCLLARRVPCCVILLLVLPRLRLVATFFATFFSGLLPPHAVAADH